MKNIFKLKNLYILIAVVILAYGGYYFGSQNTESSTSNKTLELTTVACLLYTSPSPRDRQKSRMPSSA